MATPKKYFRDHLVLLLLSVNVFLALLGSIFILIRLSTQHTVHYIVHYRPTVPFDTYKSGNATSLLGFAVFALLLLTGSVLLSLRTYRINRNVAITILSMGILLLVLTLIVSNALLKLP